MDRGPPFGRPGPSSFGGPPRMDDRSRLKDGGASHASGLNDRLLKMFSPRPPLPAAPSVSRKPRIQALTGVAHLLGEFEDEEECSRRAAEEKRACSAPRARLFQSREFETQARLSAETIAERRVRRWRERREAALKAALAAAEKWDPSADPRASGDPFCTLFVSNLSFEATERRLRRCFEEYGPVRSVRIVQETAGGRPRGYAFVEYEHKEDMKAAYKAADGVRIEGRRCSVDVERGRTVAGWKPRRLRPGLGAQGERPSKPPKNVGRLFAWRLVEDERQRLEQELERDWEEREAARRAELARAQEADRPSHDEERPSRSPSRSLSPGEGEGRLARSGRSLSRSPSPRGERRRRRSPSSSRSPSPRGKRGGRRWSPRRSDEPRSVRPRGSESESEHEAGEISDGEIPNHNGEQVYDRKRICDAPIDGRHKRSRA